MNMVLNPEEKLFIEILLNRTVSRREYTKQEFLVIESLRDKLSVPKSIRTYR